MKDIRSHILFWVTAALVLVTLYGELEPPNVTWYNHTDLYEVDDDGDLPTSDENELLGYSLERCFSLCTENEGCISYFHTELTRLCKFEAVVMTSAVTLESPNDSAHFTITERYCSYPANYSFNRVVYMCLQFHRGNDSIEELRGSCSNVMVKGWNFQRFLVNALKVVYPTDTPSFTMGAFFDDYIDPVWRWSDKTPITWFNWAPDQNDTDLWDSCIVADASNDFKWKSVMCNETMDLAYVCSSFRY